MNSSTSEFNLFHETKQRNYFIPFSPFFTPQLNIYFNLSLLLGKITNHKNSIYHTDIFAT